MYKLQKQGPVIYPQPRAVHTVLAHHFRAARQRNDWQAQWSTHDGMYFSRTGHGHRWPPHDGGGNESRRL